MTRILLLHPVYHMETVIFTFSTAVVLILLMSRTTSVWRDQRTYYSGSVILFLDVLPKANLTEVQFGYQLLMKQRIVLCYSTKEAAVITVGICIRQSVWHGLVNSTYNPKAKYIICRKLYLDYLPLSSNTLLSIFPPVPMLSG